MKFNFKIQQYQTDAVNSIVKVFEGQPYYNKVKYIRDVGEVPKEPVQMKIIDADEEDTLFDNIGFINEKIELTDEQLLKNIRDIQSRNNIKLASSLNSELGRVSLDVEMETGTGKTYAYIKTMYELNKYYGWSKFIIVVPSIAIREGVKKSFEMTVDHFMQEYKKKIRYFIYNSSKLNDLDDFSSSAQINVMIINTQAFATSLKEGAKNKESRIIYSERDDFQSRRPIDVIKANRPIMILDEPQKMGGEVVQKSLKNFNPLFSINYSATHAKEHNLVYVLDALDAYNKRLVKKIEVKGFELKKLKGIDSYLYLENIIISPKKPPRAKIELEILFKASINRETRILGVEDDLYHISNQMEQYKDRYIIKDIDPILGTVTFLNGEVLANGDVVGNISEKDMRRIQIRETILSHFEKEEKLFNMGIKTLSLFFIDQVAKYRLYDENGDELLGEYGRMFEEEYINILNEKLSIEDTPYMKYLKNIGVGDTHKGYFSIDKKTNKAVDCETKKGSEYSDDISAYDLILKNKERLLDFNEPTRFIFSHSALREGWDNPNVFQICTLKYSENNTAIRQEVGRGLRLCVNQHGNRMDKETVGEDIHDINKLTVIANDGYKNIVTALQSEIKKVLYNRPSKATYEYFDGKTMLVNEEQVVLNNSQAKEIYRYLLKNDYVDNKDNITDDYRIALANNTLAKLPEELSKYEEGIHILIQGVFDDSVLDQMIEDGNKTKIIDNDLNDNFFKKEFQALWNYINHKYAYTVEFTSSELIKKSIDHINENLSVSETQYTVAKGEMIKDLDANKLDKNEAFKEKNAKTSTLKNAGRSQVKYDLVGKVTEGTTLTRKTVSNILRNLNEEKLGLFAVNPEEFINKVIKLIKEQKATMIVEHIEYNQTDGGYDSSIFTQSKAAQDYAKAFKSRKHIQDYVFTDGVAEQSVERRFAQSLDVADEVCVYAKLPKGFAIPTPVGNYSPDWAIAFNEGAVKHIYFIAETKGTMDSLQLRPIEQAKISCAKKLFNEISTSKVRYHDVDSYQSLLDIMESII